MAKTKNSPTPKAKAYYQASKEYAEELISEIRKTLEQSGDTYYELPSVAGEDSIIMGDPIVKARPTSVFVTSKGALKVTTSVDSNDDNEPWEAEESLSYPTLGIESLEVVKELMKRDLDVV